MAWTPDKNELLYQMLKERYSVEGNLTDLKQWNLARNWTKIIDKFVTDKEKQLILNDLIDDKVIYIDNNITATSDTGVSLGIQKTTLLTNKELVP